MISSPRLNSLWQTVEKSSHPEYPFLSAAYSPSTHMPAADFTPWIAECLAADDWDSIRELMKFIAHDTKSIALEKSFRNYSYSTFLAGDASLLNELKAVAILCYRIEWTGYSDSHTRFLAELILHLIASHSFAIHDSVMDHLFKGANDLINRQNKEMQGFGAGIQRDMVTPSELREINGFTPGIFGSSISKYPISFRACLGYSLDRGSSARGLFYPQLGGHYNLRQYGLSDSANQSFLTDCGIFVAPDDLSLLADRLQKADLVKIGAQSGIDLMKSWKKDKMIALLLESESARDLIVKSSSQNLCIVRSDAVSDFERWESDLKRLKNIALCLATA